MLPIRKHLFCSCLVPGQGFGTGSRLRPSPGIPGPGSAALAVPRAGAGCPRRGWSMLVPRAAGMGVLGPGEGPGVGSPGGAVCLVLPPAACQL